MGTLYIALLGILIFVCGFGTGFCVAYLLTPKKSGNLIIDNSDPDGPFLFLEMKTDPRKLKTGRLTVLKVVDKDYFNS